MPWIVEKRGAGPRPWKIIKETTGEIVGSSVTRALALASVRARYAAEAKPQHVAQPLTPRKR